MRVLGKQNNSFFINNKTLWKTKCKFSKNFIDSVFKFAYDMSFGIGEHRDHRSGGNYKRRKVEIFINTFQGKLSEFAFYYLASKHNFDIKKPDLSTWSLGRWDSFDFEINNKKINIKSTKHYGNLLLLETKDWDETGKYIPNKLIDKSCEYDFFVLIRIKPDGEAILRNNRILYSDTVDKETLQKIIFNEQWEFDIPGFIDKNDFLEVISTKQIISKNSLLNGKTVMDAENYYVQSGDLKPIESLFLLI